MATLVELYNLRYQTQGLKNRLTAACAKSAQYVLIEDPATVNHAQRLVWAHKTLADAPAMAEALMWGLLSNATVANAGEAATDNDIEYVVASLIDTFAAGL